MNNKRQQFFVLTVRLFLTFSLVSILQRLLINWKELILNQSYISSFFVLLITTLLTAYTVRHFNRTLLKFGGLVGEITLFLTYLGVSYFVFRYGGAFILNTPFQTLGLFITLLLSAFIFIYAMYKGMLMMKSLEKKYPNFNI